MSLKSCIVALPLVTFCLVYKVACLVDPIVKITETDPPVDLITHADNANQGADAQMSCVVLNKPENYDVYWLLVTNISSEIRVSEQSWIQFSINLHVVKSADVQQICDYACLDVYSPVCCSDGRTYSNGCHLSLANCGKPTAVHVTLASQGACGAAVVDVA
ncbi:PI-actitoxin-Avd5a [Biomphalaria pfeifferi]|uniref:PI-actitoxin-Avd5a n=1 Tax=Biomphalaria pfeifferi TaxID=112525 RepID=A0AAD8BXU9_BIOPF|nr:PI-actitoxin-Avd5a [Biomphalaria pfeifferi]